MSKASKELENHVTTIITNVRAFIKRGCDYEPAYYLILVNLEEDAKDIDFYARKGVEMKQYFALYQQSIGELRSAYPEQKTEADNLQTELDRLITIAKATPSTKV